MFFPTIDFELFVLHLTATRSSAGVAEVDFNVSLNTGPNEIYMSLQALTNQQAARNARRQTLSFADQIPEVKTNIQIKKQQSNKQ